MEGEEGANENDTTGSATKGQRKTRSMVYNHFIFCEETQKWKCQLCVKSFKKSSDGGTGSLSNHLKNDHKDLYARLKGKSQSKETRQSSYGVESTNQPSLFNNILFQEKVVQFIVATDQSFMVVEDRFFEDMIKYATRQEPLAQIPSRRQARDIIRKMYNEHKESLKSTLRDNGSSVSFTLDTWTSSNHYSFMGITAHFVDENWKLRNTVLDLVLLDGSHTGLNLAQAFSKVLDEFDLWDKFFGLASDNASNMSAMCRHLDRMAIERGAKFSSQNSRVRCMAHVINLSCQAAIKAVGNDDDTDDENEDFNDEGILTLGLVTDYSVVLKIKKIVKTLRRSHIFTTMLEKQCVANEIESKAVILDVKHRWNSTLKMLQRAQELRVPLEMTLQKFRKLKDMVPSEDEWIQVEDMINLLLPFEDATNFMSCETIPKVSDTVVVYNALFNHLESYTEEKHSTCYMSASTIPASHPRWLRGAATEAWKVLSKYYPSVDGLVYSVATVLDPRYKLDWYVGAEWNNDWIDSCRVAVTSCWNEVYKPEENSPASEEFDQTTPRKRMSFIEAQLRGQLLAVKGRNKSDELTKYLTEPIVSPGFLKTTEKFSEISGILGWWKMNEESYPNLSRMARDHLAVPGTSVPCERLFSSATDLLSPRRQRLLPDTIKECMMLKHWLKQIPDSEMLKLITEKALGEI